MGTGQNDAVIAHVIRELPCQVGGGVRTPARARALLDAGARRIITGSALFRDGTVDIDAAAVFRDAIGIASLVAAVDCRGGEVRAHGWKTGTGLTAAHVIATLEPFTGAFLCTLIDTEGTLGGIDLDEIARLRALTTRHFIAAGGIRSTDEIEALQSIGADAVVGMAIYTGMLRA
jgi:phosphoribosylformimino-5-aminoimidazole carboxamide ribotide isomerase